MEQSPKMILPSPDIQDILVTRSAPNWNMNQIIDFFLVPLEAQVQRVVVPNCQKEVKILCKDLRTRLKALEADTNKGKKLGSILSDASMIFDVRPGKQVVGKTEPSAWRELPIPGSPKGKIQFFGHGIYDILGYILSTFAPRDSRFLNLSTPTGGLGALDPKSVKAIKNKQSQETLDFFDPKAMDTVKQEFFKPLLYLYARWCKAISKDTGIGAPAMVQIAVRAKSPTILHYALGASVAGFDSSSKDAVIKARRDKLDARGFLAMWIPPDSKPGKENAAHKVKLSQMKKNLLEISPMQLFAAIGGKPEVHFGSQRVKVWNPEMTDSQLRVRVKQEWKDRGFSNALIDLEDTYTMEKKGGVTFTEWPEVYTFAERWLNPEFLKMAKSAREKGTPSSLGGTTFGNCAETYPLLMLTDGAFDQAQSDETESATGSLRTPVLPWGGLAVQVHDGAGTPNLTGLCLNCCILISSAIKGIGPHFLTGEEPGFPVSFEALAAHLERKTETPVIKSKL